MSSPTYRGRFAPSPSGPLHFGSLVCALASYLDAKKAQGEWLVRIEDIDPPREQAGATQNILNCLQTHGLHWDGELIYQSERSDRYHQILKQLSDAGLTYPCDCTRKRLAPLEGRYDDYCRHRNLDYKVGKTSLRLKTSSLPDQFSLNTHIDFNDAIQGHIQEDLQEISGDFVIHRKDGLFAYQLAVVVDDMDQGITEVVRGVDLIGTTTRQIYLLRMLGAQPPNYTHIPIITNSDNNKLSKQNHAPAIKNENAIENLRKACKALSIEGEESEKFDTTSQLLNWAIPRWSRQNIANNSCFGTREIQENSLA